MAMKVKNPRKRRRRTLRRGWTTTRSRLDPFTFEIMSLHRVGATGGDIWFYLLEKRIRVGKNTVNRFIRKMKGAATNLCVFPQNCTP